ncbi:26S proteasome non-ATPase regulatory subunit, putative [Entamoeba invadens IP1]|uniref:26S proteasome non-ATPase regulatory subunit, putative n=1 Tax=Entamoeba invadens IP1 TaxID=370355 RepID=A0A0A1UH86_ENTIV|nr:26S proteasome non-ATPase regulatory subunit, putative [Entamoeba invadens IP1]ELP94887.1 26S proteasome non-ATPase regulatory subunit, putative [Entamoeba invadens IP1]|eukprot:XP_004261658.1 26S proteasome non-ATPase regulatory subunit, putative [Entamoeba invadens IP1]
MEVENTTVPIKSVEGEDDETKMSVGMKIDKLFVQLEKEFNEQNIEETERLLEETKVMIEKGGDWDRRNRRRVYEGLYLITFKRDFVKASSLLVESIGTFAVSSLISFERFVFIASISGILCFDRNKMKKSILDNPDVISASVQYPCLLNMGNALYKSDYATFISELKNTVVLMMNEPILAKSADWFCKEMRIKAYVQIMRSYLAVRLDVFAQEFGLPVDFIEKELERFISQGRLPAQIDKVNGIVMNAHKDKRNEFYVTLVKNGDTVVEKLQRLERKME